MITPEQQAAYIFAQSVSALIEAIGMLSSNLYRIKSGLFPLFPRDEFNALIAKYGIGHNAVLGFYQQ